MKTRLVLFAACSFLVLAFSACQVKSETVDSISLDFPHGEARLLVWRGGEARLFYAELPNSLVIKSGVFDIDELYGQLQNRIHDKEPAEDRSAGQPFGMVTFSYRDGSSKDYFTYDGEFAEGIFMTACSNVLESDGMSSLLYGMVCEDRVL